MLTTQMTLTVCHHEFLQREGYLMLKCITTNRVYSDVSVQCGWGREDGCCDIMRRPTFCNNSVAVEPPRPSEKVVSVFIARVTGR